MHHIKRFLQVVFGRPTTVNNVETLACAPLIINRGAGWYAGIGAKTHPGPVLYGISGHVNRPGVYEYPSGMLITDMINEVASGMRGGKALKAVIPGGSSVPVLRADMIDGVCMDGDSLRGAGSMLGTAGMLILDEDTDMVSFLRRITHFYHHESCGQCTPCREGTGWMMRVMDRLVRGEAEPEEIDMLLDVTKQVEGHTICALGDAAAWPIQGLIRHFRDEIEDRIKAKRSGKLSSVAAE